MDIRREIQEKWFELNQLQKISNGSEADRQRADTLLSEIEQLDISARSGEVAQRYGFGNQRPIMYPDVGSDYHVRSKGPFPTFGAQLLAIQKAGVPGNEIDPKLFQVRAAGMSETIPSDGGFLVSTDFSREIWRAAFASGQVMNLVRRIPIQSNSIKINAIAESTRASSRWGGIVGYWLNEGGTKQPSAPKFRQMELTLKKCVCYGYATDELLADSNTLEGVIREGFAAELAFQLDSAIVNGLGVGQPLGIMNSGCLVKVTRSAASSIGISDITGMWSRLIPGSHANSTWLVGADSLPQLLTLSQTVGTQGFPVYLPAGGLSQTPYSTLMGRPLIICEQCQTLGTSGDILLGDFSQYLLATKGETKFDSSIHVRFQNDETTFRAVTRVDGQPALAVPVTPAKSSQTLSHFICLS